jgi:hypothetical protein
MKTYENFISDLFVVKLTKEIVVLGNTLTSFINQNIELTYRKKDDLYRLDVFKLRIYNYSESQNSKKQQRMCIYFNDNYNFISLDYLKNVLEIAILSQTNNKKLVDIEEFLKYILSLYAIDTKNYVDNMNVSMTYTGITLDKIPEIIKKINQEEFDLFVTIKTYNL